MHQRVSLATRGTCWFQGCREPRGKAARACMRHPASAPRLAARMLIRPPILRNVTLNTPGTRVPAPNQSDTDTRPLLLQPAPIMVRNLAAFLHTLPYLLAHVSPVPQSLATPLPSIRARGCAFTPPTCPQHGATSTFTNAPLLPIFVAPMWQPGLHRVHDP